MESNEEKKDTGYPDKDRQIQLVVNHSGEEDNTINLGNVFMNMKKLRQVYLWVLMLCLAIGLCLPLLLYQLSNPQLTVSSVVTLRYETPVKVLRDKKDGSGGREWVVPDDPEYVSVSDLSAPDGEDLDLNQITSSSVLQTTLDGMTLSQPVTVAMLRRNIRIQTVLTEESRRNQEAIQGLADAKNSDAYTKLASTEMKYQNKFIVSLTNGFGEEDSRAILELKEYELKQLLDRVLAEYNNYLVKTYADIRLPEDQFSAIDTKELDVLDALDKLRDGISALQDYGEEKTDTVKEYRSWKTGRSLADWIETLKTFRSINVDYLYTMASENAVTRDKATLLTGYKYLLRNTQNELQKTNEAIEETGKILANYKNDEIFVSMQESDADRTTKAATDYYNELVLQQAKNYDQAQELKVTAADYENRILRLEAATETEITEAIEAELTRSVDSAEVLYEQIREHMEELFESSYYTTYEEHSMPQGRLENFLTASAKKIVIGAVAGAVIAFGLWFLAGLAPEFSRNGKAQNTGKEAAE